jgi:uncharacterized membrane protein YkgB
MVRKNNTDHNSDIVYRAFFNLPCFYCFIFIHIYKEKFPQGVQAEFISENYIYTFSQLLPMNETVLNDLVLIAIFGILISLGVWFSFFVFL